MLLRSLTEVTGALLVLGIAVILAPGVEIAIPGFPHIHIKSTKDLIEPPGLPLEGVLAPNNELEKATILFNGTLQSSESVQVDEDGSLLLIDKYADVWTAAPDASAPGGYRLASKPIAHMGATRPLGFKRDNNGDVIVCNTAIGLYKLEKDTNKVVLLGSRVSADSPIDPGSLIRYANTLDISPTAGVVYFSDSQSLPPRENFENPARVWWDTFRAYMQGVYSGQATGRLLAYYPNNGTIHVLTTGIWFANGVALSKDESFVVVADTTRMRLLRYWLKGPKAGKTEVFIDGLPGYPDGISRSPSDPSSFWVALPAQRTKLYDILMMRPVRILLAYLPDKARPPIPRWGAVVKVSEEGKVTQFLADMDGSHVSFISHVEEHPAPGTGRPRVWLGNVNLPYLAYIDL